MQLDPQWLSRFGFRSDEEEVEHPETEVLPPGRPKIQIHDSTASQVGASKRLARS